MHTDDPFANTPYDVELASDGRVLRFVDNRHSHYIARTPPDEFTREQATDVTNKLLAKLAATSAAFGRWYYSGGDTKAEAQADVAFDIDGTTVKASTLRYSDSYGLAYWTTDLWNEPAPDVYGELHIRLGNTGASAEFSGAAFSLILNRRIAETMPEPEVVDVLVDCLTPVIVTVTRAGSSGNETLYRRSDEIPIDGE